MKKIFTLLYSLLGLAPLWAQSTGNYDVVYQKLEFEADPAVHFISGSVTTHYVALTEMEAITFDLHDMLEVSSVKRNGADLDFEQNGNKQLIITLPAAQAEGVLDSLTVNYSGFPPFGNEAFVTEEHNGVPVLWTLSQPYGSLDWWPCKHDLTDKIDSLDVYIRAPEQYVSVANGVEQSQELHGDGTKTTHFKHQYPIPAYLVAIAVSNYSIFTQMAGTAPNEYPIVNYIYPEDLPVVQPQLDVTLPIMDFYEDTFETYPYHEEKYGHAQCGFGGGMEHSTVSFVGSFGRNLIAHEAAHQWFGNKITCGSWQDLWLNEGFATYLSGMVVEHLDGNDSFRDWKATMIGSITSEPGGSVYVPAIDTLDHGRLFSSRLTYNKGAMVVHMLRYKLGDENFFQGVKNYLADEGLAYGFAKTPQLQEHLEAASGMDLTEFFNDWIYNEGYPIYTVTAQNQGWIQAKINISQAQSHPSVSFFEMPVKIRFFHPSGQTYDVVVENTENNQEFIVDIPFVFNDLQVNPENDIITLGSTTILNNAGFDYMPDIKLYPNPAGSRLSVEVPNHVTIEHAVFYNTLGEKVMETTTTTSWNIAALAEGTYFITLTTNKGSKELKFVKE